MNSTNTPTYLVTGATGFIGAAVCQEFSKIACVRGSARGANISQNGTNFQFFQADLAKNFNWKNHLNEVDVVIHCGARVHIFDEQSDDPLREFRLINVDGTINLATQAAECGVRRFIFLSSIGVHGLENSGRPYRFDDVPNPSNPYALSKYEAEIALFELGRQTGMEIVCIRPPLVYGYGAPGNFAKLLRALASGFPIPLGAVTQNKRSYVFVDNLLSLIKCCTNHPAAANQVFLVSDDESLSTVDLLRRVARVLEQPARIISIPIPMLNMAATLMRKRDVIRSLCGSLEVDIEKTKELLDWVPPFGVDEGLRRTVRG